MSETPAELSSLTPQQIKALHVGDLVSSTAIESPEFQRNHADEAFFTLTNHGGVDITFGRQQVVSFTRHLRLSEASESNATMEVMGIDSTAATVLVSQIRYPVSAVGDFFLGLATAVRGRLDDVARAKLVAALTLLTEADAT